MFPIQVRKIDIGRCVQSIGMKKSTVTFATVLALVPLIGFAWSAMGGAGGTTVGDKPGRDYRDTAAAAGEEMERRVLPKGDALVVPQPWSPDIADRLRMSLAGLSDAELRGNRHSLGKAAGETLQGMIDQRLASAETVGSFGRMRSLFHMMILRECQLEELARRDFERNRFGHSFGKPSVILGGGYSRKYDADLENVRNQRAELAKLFLVRAVAVGDSGRVASFSVNPPAEKTDSPLAERTPR